MKLNHPTIHRAAGLLASALIRTWMGTLEYKAAFYDPKVDPAHADHVGQKIYVFWHENILFPLYLRGHCHLSMLVSRHRDADILSEVATQLGFDFTRGSSFGGGASALLELMRKGECKHLTITPDGPRGPRRTLAQGPVFLASKTGLPIVVMGFGYNRPWRLNSWDRFAIPRPFSRARAVLGPEMHIPANLDRQGLEHYRVEIEVLLNRLTAEAGAWAEQGDLKLGETPLHRQAAAHGRLRRLDPAHLASV